MDIVRGEFESLGYISSRERGRAEYLTRAKSPVGAEIAITVAAGSRVVLDRCGIRRIKRGPASCHNRQSKHRGSRSAISNLCFASALITYGNGHPVDPCTHTRTRSLHPRVARVSIVGLPVWFTVLERDDTSANDIDVGVTRIFSSNNGRKKKGGIDEFHYRCTNLRIFAFIVSRFQRVFFSFFDFFGVLRSISALVASDGTQLESDTRVIIRRGWRNGRIQRAVTFSKISGLTVGVVLEPMGEGGGLERCFGVRLTCKSLKAPLVFEPPPFCPVIPTKTSSSIKIMKRNAIHARGQKFLSSWFWGGEGKGTYVSSGVKIII